MVNKMTFRERLVLLLVGLFMGILGGLVAFLGFSNIYLKNNNIAYTEKVTEKQVYLENSASIQAVKKVSNSLITLIDQTKKEDFLALNGVFRAACFDLQNTNCGLNAVVLTSDGIIASVSGDKDLEERQFLAYDNNGKQYQVKFLSEDEQNGLVFFQLYREGDEVLKEEIRSQNYSFVPINLADLKVLQIGQKVLVMRSNIFNSLVDLEENIIAGLIHTDQIGNWPLAFSTNDYASTIILSNKQFGEGNIISDLNGGLVGILAKQGELLNVEVISNNLSKYKASKATKLKQLDFGLNVIRNSKELAQKLGYSVDYGYILATKVDQNAQLSGGAVKTGMIGEKIGLKDKDLIIEVDGISLLYENLWNLLNQKLSGDDMSFKIIRGKEIIELKGKY